MLEAPEVQDYEQKWLEAERDLAIIEWNFQLPFFWKKMKCPSCGLVFPHVCRCTWAMIVKATREARR